LSQQKKIICYHDEDAGPNVAFDLLDFNGKKLKFFPIKKDILNLKISNDEKQIAFSLTHGEVYLLKSDGNEKWHKKINGEILDLDVSSGDHPKVAVLFLTAKGQKLIVFDENGKTQAEGIPPAHMEQIEIAPLNMHLVLYGNNSQGQNLLLFEGQKKTLKAKWHISGAKYVDFTPSVQVTKDFILMSYEDSDTKHNHVLLFDFEGKLLADIALQTEEGAYLYSHSFAEERAYLYIATDDSTLSAFKISKDLF
ncbi:MAG: hypothetical protein HY843_07265, partial [Bdellovibrio sp.]|nr:hypothetical protein [Bdellovibrio sp.]